MPEKNQTVREYLDEIGVYSGDERSFVLIEGLFSQTRMEVSRRYIESAPWKYLLDQEIFTTIEDRNMYGQRCLCIITKGEAK